MKLYKLTVVWGSAGETVYVIAANTLEAELLLNRMWDKLDYNLDYIENIELIAGEGILGKPNILIKETAK